MQMPDFGTDGPRRKPKKQGLAVVPPKRRAEIQAMGRAKVLERMQKHDRRAGPVIQQLRGLGCSLWETAWALDLKMHSPGVSFGFGDGRRACWSPMAVKRIEDRLDRMPEAGGE